MISDIFFKLGLIDDTKGNADLIKKRMDKTFSDIGKKVDEAMGPLNRFKTILAVIAGPVALGAMAKSFINAASESEQYQIRLSSLLRSQTEGNKLFQDMTKYASKVPFQYKDIMESATQLSGILKGGVKEIDQWMPLIGDLAAASGLSIQETTDQVSRMLSAGAASADLFRQRGVLSMLGFTAGVNYSVGQTRATLVEAWTNMHSQFRGAADKLGQSWAGIMSMFEDKWFIFRNKMMQSGLFSYIKSIANSLLHGVGDALDSISNNAQHWDHVAVSVLNNVLAGVGVLADGFRGFHIIFKMLEVGFHAFWTGILEDIAIGDQYITKVLNLFGGHHEINKDLQQYAIDSKKDFDATTESLQKLVMQKMPSETIREWADNATKAASQVKKVTNEALAPVKNAPKYDKNANLGFTPKEQQAAIKSVVDYLNQQSTAIDQSLMTDNEKANAAYKHKSLILDEALARDIISQQEYHKDSIRLEMEKQAKLGDLSAIGYLQRQKFAEMSTRAQTHYVLGQITQLTQGVAQNNRAMFEINKIASIANAVVNTYESATTTMKAYPYPYNIAMAALSLAAGFAQVRAIQATTFSGGGTGSGSISGGGSVAPSQVGQGGIPVVNQPQQQAQQSDQPQMVTNYYYIVGNEKPSQAFIEATIQHIATQVNEGSKVFIKRTSPQAVEIARAAKGLQ